MTRKNIVIDRTSNLAEILSDQERVICYLLINGYSNAQISTELNVPEDSVRNAIMGVFDKIGFNLEKILTERQREICELIIEGRSDDSIAETLKRIAKSQKARRKPGENITEGTVRIHVSNIFRVIGIHSRSDLIVCYRKLKEAAAALTVNIPPQPPQPPANVKLRLDGEGALPNVIPITFKEKRVFTIGRHDINIARKQRDFEFDNTDATSSISRMHAVIEQLPSGGYAIKDKSRFGTIVNDEKLLYDVPRRIFSGDRISLADTQINYVFEEQQEGTQ
ncbi:MAG: LuxR C-terminal-related transcriptional regulator [Oscillospiraceae bacterium]|nr:LuxR C-terminal-related transcriptional regulator [Oscillospiraceae bacterium]